MGIAAGGVFLIFEMGIAGNTGSSAFIPVRMIGAIVLGEGALPTQPTIGLAVVVPVALAFHFALSALYGAVFGAIATRLGILRSSHLALIGAASIFGLLLWLVNFYVVAPVLFPWFLMSNPVVQFLAHTFFFGTVLGLLLAARPRARTGDEQ
jgi:hypothetical protein